HLHSENTSAARGRAERSRRRPRRPNGYRKRKLADIGILDAHGLLYDMAIGRTLECRTQSEVKRGRIGLYAGVAHWKACRLYGALSGCRSLSQDGDKSFQISCRRIQVKVDGVEVRVCGEQFSVQTPIPFPIEPGGFVYEHSRLVVYAYVCLRKFL